MRTKIFFALIIIATIAVLFVALFSYVQQKQACDRAHGVLVKSGLNNVCVDKGDVIDTDE